MHGLGNAEIGNTINHQNDDDHIRKGRLKVVSGVFRIDMACINDEEIIRTGCKRCVTAHVVGIFP